MATWQGRRGGTPGHSVQGFTLLYRHQETRSIVTVHVSGMEISQFTLVLCRGGAYAFPDIVGVFGRGAQ